MLSAFGSNDVLFQRSVVQISIIEARVFRARVRKARGSVKSHSFTNREGYSKNAPIETAIEWAPAA